MKFYRIVLVLAMVPPWLTASPVSAPADGAHQDGNAVVLVAANVLNGSFETGLRPWVSRKAGSSQDHFADAIIPRDGQPAPAQGERMLVMRSVNKDMQRATTTATLNLKKLTLEAGRRFRLSWKARTRSDSQFDRTSGDLRLTLADGSTVVVASTIKALGTAWTEFVAEGVYSGDVAPVSASVNIGLFRGRAAGPVECEGYVDDVRLEQMPAPKALAGSASVATAEPPSADAPRNPIPVTFELKRASDVTLVIEDESGKRIRNLVSGEHFEAGSHTVWWDGLDEGVPVTVSGSQSQAVRRTPVKPGSYRVRGLAHDPLKLTYDFTVLPNIGNPPWPTSLADGNGGWLGDHGTPAGVGYIPASLSPAGVEEMLLTSTVAESAQGVAWVDLQGRKLAGRHTLGGTWTGATHVSADLGNKRNPDVYLYTFMPWTNKQGREIRIMGMTKAGALTVGKISYPDYVGDADTKAGNPVELGIEGGMAVHDGMLVYSVFGPDRLYFMDVGALSAAQPGKPLGEAAVNKPHGLAFLGDGSLLVLSDRQVLRYRLGAFPEPLSKPEVVIADGLEEPRALSVDAKDNIYISDWGHSHQVKVFTRDGRFVRALGKPGVPHTGAFDPEHMNYPFGVAVTPSGQVWVTMRPWRTPKTVAVWKTDGTFVRNFYGPTAYGGGGFLDPHQPGRLLYSESTQGGAEYRLDWKDGHAVPTRIYWLKSETPVYQPKRWNGPMFPRRIDGADYITNEFGGPTSGASLLTLWKDDGKGGMTPASFVGLTALWPDLDELLLKRFPELSAKNPRERFRFAQTLLVTWSDANGDGLRQDDECEFRSFAKEPDVGRIEAATLAGDNFTVLITHQSGVLELKPYRVEKGVPYYHLADLHPVATGLSYANVRSSGRSQTLESDDGTLVVTGGPIMGVKDGRVKWIYHSQWPDLQIGHASPRLPEYPGQLLATTRLVGPMVRPPTGDAGQLWAINSNRGVIYLFTSDGLFVAKLFTYPGEGDGLRWDMPECRRGMDVSNINLIDECFFPSINQLPDGDIYLVAGKNHASLVRVGGLDSVRRFEAAPVTVTADSVRAINAHENAMARWRRAAGGDSTAEVVRQTAPIVIDGKLDDWPAADWLPVGKGRITRRFSATDVVWTEVALGTDGQNLRIAVRTRQKNLLGNSGADPKLLFTTGGALDIQLATRPEAGADTKIAGAREGDVRLLVSLVDGKPFAMRYRPRVPGTTNPVVFETTVSNETIDRIDDVSGEVRVGVSRITLDRLSGGLMGEGDFDQFEISVPLAVLGWDINALPVTRGDVGVLLGRPGATLERVYWHNLATGLVSDVPSEAKLQPSLWGEFRVQGP